MNDDILAALKTVIDPELGINIVDLGLVYHAARTTNGIDIELTMTTPACLDRGGHRGLEHAHPVRRMRFLYGDRKTRGP